MADVTCISQFIASLPPGESYQKAAISYKNINKDYMNSQEHTHTQGKKKF